MDRTHRLDGGSPPGQPPSWRTRVWATLGPALATLRWRLGVEALAARTEALERRADALDRAASVWTVSSWIEQASLDRTPLISVILATRNRSRLLARAVASVTAQRYSAWEIVLIDDGSTDDTSRTAADLARELDADRCRVLHIPASGVGAARNRGLDAARGELIAYLDDDNVMHPLWLKAVAWAFSQRPDIDVVYGGVIVDDFRRLVRRGAGDLPSLHLNAFDADALRRSNLADIGAIAHRRLPAVRFDESLKVVGDWDLFVRLTREKPPLALPVIACYYSTAAADRLTEQPCFADEVALLQSRFAR